jgi:type IV pilus assembly protein PilP
VSTLTKTSLAVALLLALAGCEEEPIRVGRGTQGGGQAQSPGPAAGPGATGEAEAEEEPDAGFRPTQYRDEDFVEADTNRDPFRSFATTFRVEAPELEGPGRDVVMAETSVDEMRVIGIVTGMPNPRAMLIDRNGVGHTVRRGEYIGRSEVVQAGGTESLPVTLNWRVDRIRADEIVLVREDPTAPNRPPLTRVLPLRDEDESEDWGTVRSAGEDGE